ncbi:DUF3618 domain-containing protein [Nocardioides sp. dk4132]|uniref:DUF3618 domain-containing protein n=1 Tax=unclassified Nocardioides TaxID=2615069 RepID=UPI00129724B5|nr:MULTISPECIES: DUF3618 domain-containing protein [unclassified Nocardioides]MQW75863.1 DUF3618 domain-containing protein [Nocardioides sp. dk4132]QGA08728.1 DUF3618 domain-containing protein [Nocardioides sp. dk884]
MSGDRPLPGPDQPVPARAVPETSGAHPVDAGTPANPPQPATAGTPDSPGTPDTPQTPDALAADVARQRAELAETVEELQARLDVRSRMSDAMTTADGSLRPELIAALAAGVAAVAGLLVLRWRRSH